MATIVLCLFVFCIQLMFGFIVCIKYWLRQDSHNHHQAGRQQQHSWRKGEARHEPTKENPIWTQKEPKEIRTQNKNKITERYQGIQKQSNYKNLQKTIQRGCKIVEDEIFKNLLILRDIIIPSIISRSYT